MSIIDKLGENLCNLPKVIAEFEDAFVAVEKNLTIKGKTLNAAQVEQTAYPFYYAALRAELKTLVNILDMRVSKVRGQLVKKYKENYSRDLGERQLNSYVDQEEPYLQARELYLECEELLEKYSAAVDAFTKRGFALRDLTEARVNDIHDTPL